MLKILISQRLIIIVYKIKFFTK
ncbi:hypothetical protein CP08DC60_0524, partial [Chlamydia psittaci 08DC60]